MFTAKDALFMDLGLLDERTKRAISSNLGMTGENVLLCVCVSV